MKCSRRWWRPSRALRRAAMLIALVVIAAACGEHRTVVVIGEVPNVTLSPATVQLQVGSSAPVRARVWTPAGVARSIAWSTNNDNVLELQSPSDSSVIVVGRAAGTASVIATVLADQGVKAAVLVQVSREQP